VVDIDFFSFPRIDPSVPAAVEVGGDVFAMFRDTPQARAFIRYLTSPDAQAIWVKRGGALSANRRVALSGYPDPLSRRAAEMLTRAEIARFDASDMMPAVVNSAFLRATLDFVQRPGALDQILDDLDRVATNASKR